MRHPKREEMRQVKRRSYSAVKTNEVETEHEQDLKVRLVKVENATEV